MSMLMVLVPVVSLLPFKNNRNLWSLVFYSAEAADPRWCLAAGIEGFFFLLSGSDWSREMYCYHCDLGGVNIYYSRYLSALPFFHTNLSNVIPLISHDDASYCNKQLASSEYCGIVREWRAGYPVSSPSQWKKWHKGYWLSPDSVLWYRGSGGKRSWREV